MEESLWDLLPDSITETIFGYIYTSDRVRLRLVCKSWNRILLQDCIPTSPEAPWEILSTDSYKNPQPYLTEVRFRSMSENRIYSFKLPPNLQGGSDGTDEARGWLCGSSRGWLVLSVGQKFNPDMMLWNPLSGATHKLPPLTTLPFFNDCLPSPPLPPFARVDICNFSCTIQRVEVFSSTTSSSGNEFIVAALFATSGPVRMALTDCRVQLRTMFVKPRRRQVPPLSIGLYIDTSTSTRPTHWHLVESSSCTGEVMLVSGEVDDLWITSHEGSIIRPFISN